MCMTIFYSNPYFLRVHIIQTGVILDIHLFLPYIIYFPRTSGRAGSPVIPVSFSPLQLRLSRIADPSACPLGIRLLLGEKKKDLPLA